MTSAIDRYAHANSGYIVSEIGRAASAGACIRIGAMIGIVHPPSVCRRVGRRVTRDIR
jgi:hypothetical protein